jgi:hypothetical protein
MADASLVIHEGAGAGSEHPVEGEVILGRERASADLVIEDPGVSRRHARVQTNNGSVIVEDLGSSNGTFVNGRRISRAVALSAGDEIQVGATVLGIAGGAAATAVRLCGAPSTAHHPGSGQQRVQSLAAARPVPRRLAPPPTAASNIPALSAAVLGPLSIALLALSAGGFFFALPCGIAAIVLGTIGIRHVERGRASGHRRLARLGRITGWIGTALSILAMIAFPVVAVALDSAEDSISGIIERVSDEIEGIEVPDAPTSSLPS